MTRREDTTLQGHQILIRCSRELTDEEVGRLENKLREELARLGLEDCRVWDRKETARLSLRQREMMCLIRDGFSNRDITERLGMKLQTVKNEMTESMYKLAARNRAQAVAEAIRRGEIELGD